MKNIDKLIRLKLYEIGITLLFLIGSFYLWNQLSNSETIHLVKSINRSTSLAYVDVVKENNYQLSPMKDEVAMNLLMPKTVSIINNTHSNTHYAFGIKMNKNSTIDYHDLKVSFQNNSYYLKDFYVKEDQDFYYFILEKGNIKESTKMYDIKLWLDEDTNASFANRTFNYEFANLADIL